MSAVGLIVHLGRKSASEQARALVRQLRADGHTVRMPAQDAAAVGVPEVDVADGDGFATGLDLVVTLGGDGSMLRAVQLVGAAGTPILGVDHGELGYLTEIEPADAAVAVERCLAGAHEIDERMLIEVTIEPADGGEVRRELALNEVVVERASDVNTIRVRVDIGDEFFTTYAADGMILATPTGSTAYAFSVRGPIVAPTNRAMLLTPVSPHMLFDRSLVLDPEVPVRLTVDGNRPATVSVDGRRIATVGDGAVICGVSSRHSARLVSFGSRRFHQVLKTKFGLNDR